MSLPINIDETTISGLRVDIFERADNKGVLEEFQPKNVVNRAWIPQTLGDQIWVLYEFTSLAERLEWESGLPPIMQKWLDRKVIPNALPYGWSVRDPNGFAT